MEKYRLGPLALETFLEFCKIGEGDPVPYSSLYVLSRAKGFLFEVSIPDGNSGLFHMRCERLGVLPIMMTEEEDVDTRSV